MAGISLLLLLLTLSTSTSILKLHIRDDTHATQGTMAGVLDDVLSPEHHPRCSVFFITDAASSDPSTIAIMKVLRVPGGVGVFTAAAEVMDGNVTLQQLPLVFSLARKLRQVSWCVTVVVMGHCSSEVEDQKQALHLCQVCPLTHLTQVRVCQGDYL
ncbi:uncharacterized protein [Procambarus clarkii]|uniref:uncharacterized protein n=1 Tax=Procambarus clarkii TaxID=6728 RepID=UPI0037441597